MLSNLTARWIVVLTFAAVPLLVWAAARIETNTDDLQIWLPRNTPDRLEYERFSRLFGPNDEIIVSWQGCRTDDPRLNEFVSRLAGECSGLFSSISSGASVLRELADRQFCFPEAQIRRNLAGFLFDSSGRTTAAIVRLSAHGQSHSRNCVDEILLAADRTTGLSREDLRIGGESYTTVQIDSSTNKALTFAIPAIFLAAMATYWSLHSFRLVLVTLVLAGLSALASVALVSASGFKFNGLLVIMPILVVVLSLSSIVHLCNYYRLASIRRHRDAVAEMLRSGWWPCTMAIVTTVIGLATLSTSRIEAVALFGLFSSLALLFSLAVSLGVFPAILRCWPALAFGLQGTSAMHGGQRVRGLSKSPSKSMFTARAWIATAIVLLAVGVSVPLITGVGNLKTTLKPERMFADESSLNRDRDWLQEKFASLNCIDVVVEFDNGASEQTGMELTEQIRVLKSIQASLAAVDHVSCCFSIASVCRLPAQRRTARAMLTNKLVNDVLVADRRLLVDQRTLAIEGNVTAWRIQMGIDAADTDVESVMDAVQSKCRSMSIADQKNTPRIWATGIWPLASAGRNQVMRELGSSFALAFVIITPLLMVVLRGLVVGLLAMIPNVMPALIFFGLAGRLGIEIDIGTVLTASVGLGIAIDNTLHFLHCFVELRRRRPSRFLAVRETIQQCFRPMFATTAICAFGLSPFAFCDFLPARNFSIAIIGLLTLALICDLILMPAIIVSPLGRFFDHRQPVQKPLPAPLLPKRVMSPVS